MNILQITLLIVRGEIWHASKIDEYFNRPVAEIAGLWSLLSAQIDYLGWADNYGWNTKEFIIYKLLLGKDKDCSSLVIHHYVSNRNSTFMFD